MAVTLGIAKGRIIIDTDDIAKARVVVERESKLMGRQFEDAGKKADASAKKAGDAWEKAGQKLNKIGTALAPIAIAGGIISGIALKAAGSIEAVDRRFRALTKSQSEADKLMQRIANGAKAFGRPIGEMQQAFADLLPKMKGGQRELEKYIGLVSRLASLRKSEGVSGASFAIGEALSSGGTDLISLAERFGISKIDLRAAISQTGDFASALDLILDKMGATEESAKEAGRGFDAAATKATESFSRALGTGIEPFRNAMTGVLNTTADFFDNLAQNAPLVLNFTTGLAGLTAVAGGLVLVLGQLVNAYSALKSAGVISGISNIAKGNVGKGAVLAGAGLAGIEGGVGLVRGLGAAGVGGFQQFKGKSQDEAKAMIGDTIKQLVVVIVNAILDLGKAFAAGVLVVKKAFAFVGDVISFGANLIKQAIGALVQALGDVIKDIGKMIPGAIGNRIREKGFDLSYAGIEIQGQAKDANKGIGDRILDVIANGIKLTDYELNILNSEADKQKKNILDAIINFMFPKQEDVEGAGANTPLANPKQFTDEQLELQSQFMDDMAEINDKQNEERLEENQKYEEQKTEIQRKGEEARLERDRDIARVRSDAVKREAEQNAETVKNITKLQEEAAKDELRATEDHQRELRDIQNKSRTDILKAASRLDAQGVYDAMQSRRERLDKENESFNIERERRTVEIAERIQQEQAGHVERLLKAREADERQIEQINERYAKEAEALGRQRAKLDEDHVKRLQQIDVHGARERIKLEENFIKEWNSMLGHGERKLGLIRKGHADIEAQTAAHVARLQAQYRALNPYTYTPPSQPYVPPPNATSPIRAGTGGRSITEFETGTSRVPGTGLYGLHDEEIVGNRTVGRLARSILGENFTQEQLASRIAGGGGSSFSFGDIHLALHDVGSKNPEELEAIARAAFRKEIVSLAQARGLKVGH